MATGNHNSLTHPKNFLFFLSIVALFLVVYLLSSDWLSLNFGSRAGYRPYVNRTPTPISSPLAVPTLRPVKAPMKSPQVPPNYR